MDVYDIVCLVFSDKDSSFNVVTFALLPWQLSFSQRTSSGSSLTS